jgi:hypothetical protein
MVIHWVLPAMSRFILSLLMCPIVFDLSLTAIGRRGSFRPSLGEAGRNLMRSPGPLPSFD